MKALTRCLIAIAALSLACIPSIAEARSASPDGGFPARQIGGFNGARGGDTSLANNPRLKKAIKKAFPLSTFNLKKKIDDEMVATTNVIIVAVAFGGHQAITPLSNKEQQKLVDFAKAGGTVLIFADNDTYDGTASVTTNASVLSPFGLAESGTSFDGGADIHLTTGPNPLANGPFGTVTDLVASFPGFFSALGSSTLAGDIGGTPAVSYLAPNALGTGSGAVVFFSDTGMMVDGFRTSDNTKAILNAMAITP